MNPTAPSVSLLPATLYRTMPWRNGRGTTTEIALGPSAGPDFAWRLSIADVPDSGPFSPFTGFERLIAVVAGAGMRLAVDGRPPATLDLHSPPYAFSGDAVTECTLVDGPIRDFNLIFDPARATAVLTRWRGTDMPARVPLDGGTVLLHALAGRLTVDAGPLGTWVVPEGDTLRLDRAAGTMMLAGDSGSHVLLARIAPH
ncbi:MAG TPA: HutD family protein [Aliidongia sp.]|uniref:HutD/Ves family protein n=1 Tax=Aliidongia sp. TaxID=1914230 RepID=UPI002DDCFBED|nr:HutD family protein [Aliidongia sp.]HEV2674687.1 HutD family protein [Aliidongia sp.]